MSPDEQNDDTSEQTRIREVPDLGSRPTSVSHEVVEGEAPPPPIAAPGPERPTAAATRTWSPAGGESPAEAQQAGAEAASDPFSDRPHVWVGAAFVGGLVFAQILKRLGGGGDD